MDPEREEGPSRKVLLQIPLDLLKALDRAAHVLDLPRTQVIINCLKRDADGPLVHDVQRAIKQLVGEDYHSY